MPEPAVEGLVIRVYADSLGLPRAPAGLGHRETYPELVRAAIARRRAQTDVALYNRSGGGLTIGALYERYLHDCSYFGPGAHQLLIIQCGIVDCAPRPVPAAVRSLIGRLPGPLRAPVTGFLHRARPRLLRMGMSWRFTGAARFSGVLSRWLAHAAGQSARTYVVNIAPTVPAIAAHSPGLAESIRDYNQRIAGVVGAAPSGAARLVDVFGAIAAGDDVAEYVNGTDGHHITEKGHRLYADLILRQEAQA